jgi:hypothetical protein
MKLACCLPVLLVSNVSAFVSSNGSRRLETELLLAMAKDGNSRGVSRRGWLLGVTAASPALLLSQQAQAKDEIFKPNPLTNGLLEQVRFIHSFLDSAIAFADSLVSDNGQSPRPFLDSNMGTGRSR